jgi:hypothetical protein
MSSEVRTGTIFISHASADLDQATEIYGRLRDKKYPVWMAVHEVKPGASYAETIIKTLDAAKALIVLLSVESISSAHVKREISLARELKLPIYPIALTDLTTIKKSFGSDWQEWLDVSALSQYSTPRDATRALTRQFNVELEPPKQTKELDRQTLIWIENASTLVKMLLSDPESDFDFVSFADELHMEIGYQLPQLETTLDEEGKLTIGEFLYSCFWTFTSLRPDWVPNDPRHQQMIHTSYLLPSGMQFNFPEAMNSLALKILESDMGLFLYWVEEKYYFDDVFDRSIDVGVRTPISREDNPDAKRTSNTLGYLIFSAGIKLFECFYNANRFPEKIDEAIIWLKQFDEVVGDKDMVYLEKICPTLSFKIWLPMVRLLGAFFEYKSGSTANAKSLLSMLSDAKRREFEQFAQSQSENMYLAEEFRGCWVDLGNMIQELKVLGQ